MSEEESSISPMDDDEEDTDTRASPPPDNADDEDLCAGLQSVTDFDFIALMDERGLVGVPETSFPHVETSQDCGVREGMVVEMPIKEKGKQYWLATVLGAHGPLLRLSYVGGGAAEGDIWRDLSSQRLFPLGWCQWNRISLEPPDSIKASCPDWQDLVLQYEESLADTISMHHIDGEGVTPVDRLKEGMMMEVQDALCPDHFWPATITESRGGLLTLKYEDLEDTLMLFYTSNRLYPLQHGQESGGRYLPPNQEDDPDGKFQLKGETIVRSAKKVAPKDLIVAFVPESGHKFGPSEVMEIIPPMASKVELAKIDCWLSDSHFVVSLVSDPSKHFLCHQHSDNIFPVGWSERHLPEACRAERVSDSSMIVAAESNFPDRAGICEEGEFEKGQKLEVLYKSQMRSATVVSAVGSIIIVELDSDLPGGRRSLLVPVPSTEIFPLGWSNANFIPCLIPSSFCPVVKNESNVVEAIFDTKESAKEKLEVSSWCPPIYFNYQCYSASFLSKAKLASLPKSVGPGSVYLVMKKVLELIIRSSFKSGSILKRLECKGGEKVPKDFVRECLKAKSRVANLKADVQIPTRSDQVNQFCREICQKVGACPYLVSAMLYDKVCPANCQSKPKSNFHAEEQSGIIFRNRGRRGGRKRRQVEQNGNTCSSKALVCNAGCPGRGGRVEEDGSSSMDEYSDETTEPPSMVNSRSASPENDSNSNLSSNVRKRHGRKEWENILPRSAIRTRGAKLPDFKLHLKIRPTKKEQRVIAINSLRESIGYDRRTSASKRAKTLAAAAAAAATPMNLEPAFKFADLLGQRDPVGDAAADSQPPPIREISLKNNPERWTCGDTARFLAQTTDCAHLAQFMIEDEMDGLSFMLLDFSTVLEFWSLTLPSAIRLCQHIESVKLAYLKQFAPPNR